MTNDDLNNLSWPAMRYALGRSTYVVETVCRVLKNNAKNIRGDIKQRMCEEISSAIEASEAGMDMDVKQWQQVLTSFNEEIK